MSLPFKILLQAFGNTLLVAAMTTYVSEAFFLSGGLVAYVTVGALFTLLNMLVRPFLDLVTLPLKLFATILSLVLVNGVFLWIVERITMLMDPDVLTLAIEGGIGGWVTAAIALGLGNWILRLVIG